MLSIIISTHGSRINFMTSDQPGAALLANVLIAAPKWQCVNLTSIKSCSQ